jgi:hypothetical protein
MGKLIVFLILGFMLYAVLKQLLRVTRFFEAKPQPQRQRRSYEQGTVDVSAREVVSAKAGGCHWVEEIVRSYELFKSGALTEEEFKHVKNKLLSSAGAGA